MLFFILRIGNFTGFIDLSAISKFIKDLREPLEIPLQLIAVEMDTNAKRIKYLNPDLCSDKISSEKYDKFISEIESGEIATEISSIDDNTILYEFDSDAIVVYSLFGVKWLFFDSFLTKKIENHIFSYN